MMQFKRLMVLVFILITIAEATHKKERTRSKGALIGTLGGTYWGPKLWKGLKKGAKGLKKGAIAAYNMGWTSPAKRSGQSFRGGEHDSDSYYGRRRLNEDERARNIRERFERRHERFNF